MASEMGRPAPIIVGNRPGGVEVGDDQTAQENKPTGNTPQARWQERNPLARWAHRAAESALKRGLIHKQPCEVCGDARADAHHDDYMRPIDVRWLCRRHHKQHHAAERKARG